MTTAHKAAAMTLGRKDWAEGREADIADGRASLEGSKTWEAPPVTQPQNQKVVFQLGYEIGDAWETLGPATSEGERAAQPSKLHELTGT